MEFELVNWIRHILVTLVEELSGNKAFKYYTVGASRKPALCLKNLVAGEGCGKTINIDFSILVTSFVS
jgi:hypothetical protein